MAFNSKGLIMIAGCDSDVEVWMFNKRQLVEQNRLKGHNDTIYCLLFSKKFFMQSRQSDVGKNNLNIIGNVANQERIIVMLLRVFCSTRMKINSYHAVGITKLWYGALLIINPIN